jgi:hypothetical protein
MVEAPDEQTALKLAIEQSRSARRINQGCWVRPH